jgi:ribosomal protein L11 methyltransferase
MRDFILAIAFDDAESEELVQSRLFLTASTGSVSGEGRIEAYFDSAEARADAAELLREFNLTNIERERVDWLAHYRQSLQPLFIGARFLVAPDASLIPRDGDRLTLIVPQEQAFGTGSHETTSLCIEMLESLPVEGMRGLDIGAGSGILAMAMLRLGAAKAIAFDNDVDAYGALRHNRMRNVIAERQLPLFIGSVEALRAGTFDVISMNIIPEVIVPLLPAVVPRLAAGARLLLSGILNVKRDEVVAAARTHALSLVDERSNGEWWAGVFSR